MAQRYGLISADEDRRNKQMFECSMSMSYQTENIRSILQMVLYNYGHTLRREIEHYNHVQPLFSRFFFFENAGATILDENEENGVELLPGKGYILTPGHPFHVIYHAGSLLHFAHFTVMDQTGLTIFRYAPGILEIGTLISKAQVKKVWTAGKGTGVLSLLSYASSLRLSEDWAKLRNEYELCSRFKPAFDLLAHTPPAQLRVGDLADAMNMTQAAFSRSFNEVMKMSPKDFLTKYYFERACELLCFSGSTVTETARLLGHNDIHNFFHVFKRIAGCSPAEYRSKRKNA